MRFSEIIKSSFTTLRMNGRRTFLTMFGIIIGIAAVITIMSLGKGFEKSTLDTLVKDQEGRLSQHFDFFPSQEIPPSLKPFSQENIGHIKGMPGVDDAELSGEQIKTFTQSVKFKPGDKGEEYLQTGLEHATQLPIVAGRNLTKDDDRAGTYYTVISANLAAQHFGEPQKALNQSVTLDNHYYTIVGVYDEVAPANDEGQMKLFVFGDTPPALYITHGSFKRGSTRPSDSYGLKVYFQPDVDMKTISRHIVDYLKQNGAAKDKGEYQYFDMSEYMSGIGRTLQMITYFISAVAALSLFIAGVGVMNMMYISVSERTKEIGIRRSLGATKRAIQWQFLLEGIAITTFGGMIGYAIGFGICSIIGNFLPFKPYTDLQTALISVLISMMIGIIFSVFPSRQAANKNVVEILR